MISKRKHPRFNVPNYGSKSRKGVKARWRRPRGIDSKKRVDKQGYGATPKIGYKNPADVRFARKEGVMEVLIHNEKELRAIQKDAKMVAVFAHDLSERKRVELQRIANTNGIRVINGVRA